MNISGIEDIRIHDNKYVSNNVSNNVKQALGEVIYQYGTALEGLAKGPDDKDVFKGEVNDRHR